MEVTLHLYTHPTLELVLKYGMLALLAMLKLLCLNEIPCFSYLNKLLLKILCSEKNRHHNLQFGFCFHRFQFYKFGLGKTCQLHLIRTEKLIQCVICK